MGTTSQPATLPIESLHHLYASSNAETYNLTRSEFDKICTEQAEYLTALNPQYRNDYILAQACAHGHNGAWNHFLAQYRQPLIRAAIAITNDPSLGQDLADSLYAELYGLTTRPQNNDPANDPATAVRKSPLASYKGRGSLIGWLRTTLAQRHVDHHRKTWREESLDASDDPDQPTRIEPIAPTPEALPTSSELTKLTHAVQQSLASRPAEDRFLLAAYFLDQQTLLQIARILQVHEATISRKLRRLVEELRKDLLSNLQSQGLSKQAAEEALGADPRDLDQLSSNLRNLLQFSQSQPFPEKAGQ